MQMKGRAQVNRVFPPFFSDTFSGSRICARVFSRDRKSKDNTDQMHRGVDVEESDPVGCDQAHVPKASSAPS